MLENVENLNTLHKVLPRSSTAVDRPTAVQISIWVGLMLMALLLAVIGWNLFQLGAYSDDASYVLLAKSILSAEHYGMVNVPGQPGATQFPFGYPLLLAPFLLLFPNYPEGAKILSLIATLINAALLFWGWRRLTDRSSYWWGLAVVAIYLLSPLAISHTRMIMSEPVFTTFCLVTILLAEQAAQRKEGPWWPVWLGIALVFVVYIRTVGIVLFAATFAYLLYYRGLKFWRKLGLVLVSMIAILGLIVALTPVDFRHLLPIRYFTSAQGKMIRDTLGSASTQAPEPGETFKFDGALQKSAPQNSNLKNLLLGFKQHFGIDLRQTLVPFGEQKGQAIARGLGFPELMFFWGYFISGVVLLGFLRLFKNKKFTLFIAFPALYLAVLMLWVWHGSRLLYPIQPQLQFAFFTGVEGLVLGLVSLPARIAKSQESRLTKLREPGTLARRFTLAIFLILLLTSVYESLEFSDSRNHIGDLTARTLYVQQATPPTAVLLTEAPVVDYLYGGRKTVPYPVSYPSVNRFERYLKDRQVDMILVAPRVGWQLNYKPEYTARAKKTLEYLNELVEQGKLALVYNSEADLIKVYQVR